MKRWIVAVAVVLSAAAYATSSAVRVTDSEGVQPVAYQQPQPQHGEDNSLSVQSWRMAPPPPWDASAAELETKGDELLRLRALNDALDYYHAAIEKTPKKQRSILHNKCGVAELHLGQFDDAQSDFVRSIKLNKKYAEAVNNLGVAYFFKRDYKKAAKIYKKAIEISPNAASYHSNLGRAYFAMKKQELAAQEYARALEIDPEIFTRETRGGIVARMPQEKGLLSYVLAKLLAARGQNDEALIYLRRAIDEGYKGLDKVYSDPEFAKLLTDQRFIDLMNARNNPGALPPR